MKLKSKIFLSYFFLIMLFSFSLLWLVIEIRELTTSQRGLVRQDVYSIIHLARQLQNLEDLNADYILLFIPGKSTDYRIIQVEKSRTEFDRNWKNLKNRIEYPYQRPWYDKILNRVHQLVFGLEQYPQHYTQEISELTQNIDQRWQQINDDIEKTVSFMENNRLSDARYLSDVRVKNNIHDLRKSLTELNKITGERGIQKSKEMGLIAYKIQRVIIGAEIFIILITLLIAFLGARRLTRPVHALKTAMDKVTIQNYDIKIKDKSNDEIGELGSAFEQLSMRLKESEAYKSAMLSQFTHEMKSPLGGIKQSTRLLEASLASNITAEQKRFISIIKGNNENLQRLITNILHSASYDSGKVRLNYSPVNIVKLVTEVLIYLSPTIKEKEIKVNLNFAAKKINCEVDEEKMKEVFQNLVNNAVKFSGKETAIDISIIEKFPIIKIEIKDQGIGIPEKEIPYIFEKLYRASNSRKISVKGTGLGLYITSQIIRAHGGRIHVESEVGKGTSFKITLPRTKRVAEEGEWLA